MADEGALLKLARVVVKPYTRRVEGETVHVEGYTYDRKGALGNLQAKSGKIKSRPPSQVAKKASAKPSPAASEESTAPSPAAGKTTSPPAAGSPASESSLPTQNRQVPEGFEEREAGGRRQTLMSRERHAEHLARIKDLIKQAKLDGEETQTKYTYDTGERDSSGKPIRKYIPSREKLHVEIINDLLDQAEKRKVPKQRKAAMSGGTGGAGKGSTLARPESGIDHSKYIEVNPDEMKQELIRRGAAPKVEGVEPLETAGLIHEESGYLAKQLSAAAAERGMNQIWDITMSSDSQVIGRLDNLDRHGYTTEAVFVSIPLEMSVERALNRHNGGASRKILTGEGDGGRFVDPDVIRNLASHNDIDRSNNETVFERVKGRFSDWKKFDNSGSAPQLISSKEATDALDRENREAHVGDIRTWGGQEYQKKASGRWERVLEAVAAAAEQALDKLLKLTNRNSEAILKLSRRRR